MYVQSSPVLELLLSEFKLEQNPTKVTKKICYAKGEGAIDHNTLTRWLNEFILSKFELSHNTADATKKISYAKDEGAIDHNTLTRWLNGFRLSGN